MDLDLNGLNEELGGPTFAAINARSYHPGGVNVMLADGSVHFVKSTLGGMVWRVLGAVAGGEVLSSDFELTSTAQRCTSHNLFFSATGLTAPAESQ